MQNMIVQVDVFPLKRNLSYIAPVLVGKIVLANLEFRKRSEVIFEENFERRKEDGKKR